MISEEKNHKIQLVGWKLAALLNSLGLNVLR